MQLVTFLRGVNVGGHRRFRPSLLVKALQEYDVANVGATGLLIVRNAPSRAAFETALRRRLPFETDLVSCDARDVLALVRQSPFEDCELDPALVPFISVIVGAANPRLPEMPFDIPREGAWYVRLIGRRKRFVFGCYRRHMKTIGYLGRIDALLGVRLTTRKWTTVLAAARVLQDRAVERRP